MNSEGARPFGFWMATALVVGSMIGSGIFVLPAQLAPFGWTGIVAWLFAIAGALVIAFVLSRLARARPDASGVVAITGDVLGPLVGVLVGWSYWVSIWSTDAVVALTAVRYLAVFVPALAASAGATALAAAMLLWMLVGLNLLGAGMAGRFQTVTTVLKLVPLAMVVVILAGISLRGGGTPALPVQVDAAALTPAVTLAFFALLGFEAASITAARVRDPGRTVPRATLAGTALTGFLYIVVAGGIVLAMPAETLAASPTPIALFVETYVGGVAGLAVAGFAAVAAIGCLNGWVLMMGEVPLGMARAGLLPRWMARTGARDVPVGMLVLSGVLASLLLLAGTTRSAAGLLDFMLRLTTAASLWLYLGACCAAIRLGVAKAAAVVGAAFCGWALWGSGAEAVGYSLILIAAALPLYWLRPSAASSQAAP